MKYKISKMQGGGALSAPTSYITLTPQAVPQVAPQQAQKTSLVDDELFKKIMDNSLTSDAMVFFQKVNRIESDPAVLLGFKNANIALQSDIIQMVNNKKNYESAKQVAKENGTLDEIAMGSDGGIYVMDSNRNIREINPKDYASNKSVYKPLTVSELLIARNSNPKLANNENVFSIVEENVSLDKILTKIDNIVKDAGKVSEEQSFIQASSPLAKNQQGFEDVGKLLQGSPETAYKITSKKSIPYTGAINYIWSSLTSAEQRRLQLESTLTGSKSNSPDEIVKNAILSRTSEERQISQEALKKGAGEGTGEGGGLSTISPTEALVRGLFPTGERFNWNDPDSGLNLSVPTTDSAKLLDYNNRPLGMAKLSEFGDNAKLAYASDLQHISFGNEKVNIGDKDKIVLDDTDVYRVYLPTKDDGTANLDYLKQVQEINENLLKQKEQGKVLTPQDFNEAYRPVGIAFDENFNMVSARAKPFIIGYGYTSDEANVITRENKKKFVQEIPSNWFGFGGEEGSLEDRLKSVYSRTADGKNKGKAPTGTLWETWYKGIIAIPLKENAAVDIAMLENNLYQKKATVTQAKTNIAINNARDVNENTPTLFPK